MLRELRCGRRKQPVSDVDSVTQEKNKNKNKRRGIPEDARHGPVDPLNSQLTVSFYLIVCRC